MRIIFSTPFHCSSERFFRWHIWVNIFHLLLYTHRKSWGHQTTQILRQCLMTKRPIYHFTYITNSRLSSRKKLLREEQPSFLKLLQVFFTAFSEWATADQCWCMTWMCTQGKITRSLLQAILQPTTTTSTTGVRSEPLCVHNMRWWRCFLRETYLHVYLKPGITLFPHSSLRTHLDQVGRKEGSRLFSFWIYSISLSSLTKESQHPFCCHFVVSYNNNLASFFFSRAYLHTIHIVWSYKYLIQIGLVI